MKKNEKVSAIRKFQKIFVLVFFTVLLFGCAKKVSDNVSNAQNTATIEKKEDLNSETNIRIITTSDLHGKMVAWDYFFNEKSLSGSLAQVAQAIKEYRDDNTIVVDVGDAIQDNSAELFLDEEIHPMILGMNNIGYDVCTLGNHEFNYGMDIVRKTIKSHKAKVLLSNVYDNDGSRLAEPFTIIERSGVKIAFIGVVTPNIVNWDGDNLLGYTVTNPIDEIKNSIKEIGDKADVIILLAHMDEDNELGTQGSGVAEIAEACPEIDFICAGHGHREIVGKDINGCTFVENLNKGQTVMVTNIQLDKVSNKWQVKNIESKSIKTADYEADENLLKIFEPYDQIAKNDARTFVGELKGGPLVEEDEIKGIKRALIEDTPLLDLINNVEMYYSGADVASTELLWDSSNILEGKITKADVNRIYKYENMLYKLKMNGKQLKKWMEWTARFYKQSYPENLTIAFNDNIRYYLYSVFSGINYEVNIEKPVGERIENLTWQDGKPVKDEDVFIVAVKDYLVNSILMNIGGIYENEEEMPEIIEKDVRSDIGNIRDMIIDYIVNVKGGVIVPEKDDNWKITGFTKNEEKQKLINELVINGKIKLTDSDDERIINTIPITEEMLEKYKQ